MFDTAHFPNAKKYWYEGKFHDWNETPIHPMAFALHYGGSVFEGIRAYKTAKGSAIFRLPEHIDRLFYSASVARMNVPYRREDVSAAIKATLVENELSAGYIRPLLFYSFGNLGLRPTHCAVELLVGAWEWGAYLGDKTEKGVSVCLIPWRRIHRSQMEMNAKLGGLYVQSMIAGLEARSLGFDEGLFLNLEGNIAEGCGENIFILRGGVLKTNDKTESILEGITRASVIELAQDLGYETVIGPILKDELLAADEAFFTGTACEIAPVVRVTDGSNPGAIHREYAIGSGQVGSATQWITKAFKDIVTGQNPKYERWLTYVQV
jgi:branched-chain amino acid aminotransferase